MPMAYAGAGTRTSSTGIPTLMKIPRRDREPRLSTALSATVISATRFPLQPGSYTVRLHFLESFFSPLIPAATCQGVGCRVFDVTCNGVLLLQDFDIVQAAHGAFQPVVREFHGLHPNGQGKLLLSFSPKVNYAEIRAIEVIDEAQ